MHVAIPLLILVVLLLICSRQGYAAGNSPPVDPPVDPPVVDPPVNQYSRINVGNPGNLASPDKGLSDAIKSQIDETFQRLAADTAAGGNSWGDPLSKQLSGIGSKVTDTIEGAYTDFAQEKYGATGGGMDPSKPANDLIDNFGKIPYNQQAQTLDAITQRVSNLTAQVQANQQSQFDDWLGKQQIASVGGDGTLPASPDEIRTPEPEDPAAPGSTTPVPRTYVKTENLSAGYDPSVCSDNRKLWFSMTARGRLPADSPHWDSSACAIGCLNDKDCNGYMISNKDGACYYVKGGDGDTPADEVQNITCGQNLINRSVRADGNIYGYGAFVQGSTPNEINKFPNGNYIPINCPHGWYPGWRIIGAEATEQHATAGKCKTTCDEDPNCWAWAGGKVSGQTGGTKCKIYKNAPPKEHIKANWYCKPGAAGVGVDNVPSNHWLRTQPVGEIKQKADGSYIRQPVMMLSANQMSGADSIDGWCLDSKNPDAAENQKSGLTKAVFDLPTGTTGIVEPAYFFWGSQNNPNSKNPAGTLSNMKRLNNEDITQSKRGYNSVPINFSRAKGRLDDNFYDQTAGWSISDMTEQDIYDWSYVYHSNYRSVEHHSSNDDGIYSNQDVPFRDIKIDGGGGNLDKHKSYDLPSKKTSWKALKWRCVKPEDAADGLVDYGRIPYFSSHWTTREGTPGIHNYSKIRWVGAEASVFGKDATSSNRFKGVANATGSGADGNNENQILGKRPGLKYSENPNRKTPSDWLYSLNFGPTPGNITQMADHPKNADYSNFKSIKVAGQKSTPNEQWTAGAGHDEACADGTCQPMDAWGFPTDQKGGPGAKAKGAQVLAGKIGITAGAWGIARNPQLLELVGDTSARKTWSGPVWGSEITEPQWRAQEDAETRWRNQTAAEEGPTVGNNQLSIADITDTQDLYGADQDTLTAPITIFGKNVDGRRDNRYNIANTYTQGGSGGGTIPFSTVGSGDTSTTGGSLDGDFWSQRMS